MNPFLSRYRAAIFDLDGTLADTMHVWDGFCRAWALERGLVPPAGLDDTVGVMTLTQAADYVTGTFAPDLSPGLVLEEWNALLVRRYARSSPKEGAEKLLLLLRERGFSMGIATSSSPGACESFLAAHRLSHFFTAKVYTHEVGADKTHPDAYLHCASLLGASPAQCVVFEDLPEAALGAGAAGMGLVAVYDESCKDWESFRTAAGLAVRSLLELCE